MQLSLSVGFCYGRIELKHITSMIVEKEREGSEEKGMERMI